jgi:hypothetical protein
MSNRRSVSGRKQRRQVRDQVVFAVSRDPAGRVELTLFSGRRAVTRSLGVAEAACLVALLSPGSQ